MSDIFTFSAPVVMGVEGLCADELKRAGFENISAENGRVLFSGDLLAGAKANLWCRTAERIQILFGQFPARTFDELFEGVKALPWEDLIPRDGEFPVKGHSVRSKLTSIPDCQKIIKKAVAVRLGSAYGLNVMPETGAKYQIQFNLLNDVCSVCIDTSGDGLHKRGYRAVAGGAPIRETLAAAMIMLSRRRGDRPLLDPMCGSGTIPIEAALMAGNVAPGLNRRFAIESFAGFDRAGFDLLRKEARARITRFEGEIAGSDIDPEVVDIANQNAKKAGVASVVSFKVCDVGAAAYPDTGIVICNPPYGERLGDLKEARTLVRVLGKRVREKGIGAVIISPDTELEKSFGREADKKRKIYNGMIRCDVYSFRPDRRPESEQKLPEKKPVRKNFR